MGEGSGWDLRVRPSAAAEAEAAASGNLGTWKSGNLEIWGPGNPEIWRSGDLEIQKLGVQQIKKNIKIQIRSAQNVGKVWISRKKILLALFGAIPGHFFHGPKNSRNAQILTIFLGGPMGPIHPVWGDGPYFMFGEWVMGISPTHVRQRVRGTD